MKKYINQNQERWNKVSSKQANPYTIPYSREELQSLKDKPIEVALTGTSYFSTSMNAISNTSKLMEITDSTVLARVNNTITGVFHSGNAGRNAVNGIKASRFYTGW